MEKQNNTFIWNNSIFIPFIYKSISKNILHQYFEENVGQIERIDLLDIDKNYRQVYIYFQNYYFDKGWGLFVRFQIEKNGYYNISIPNEKNKKNPYFYTKIYINKYPISLNEFKLKQQLKSCLNKQNNFEKIMKNVEIKTECLNAKLKICNNELFNSALTIDTLKSDIKNLRAKIYFLEKEVFDVNYDEDNKYDLTDDKFLGYNSKRY